MTKIVSVDNFFKNVENNNTKYTFKTYNNDLSYKIISIDNFNLKKYIDESIYNSFDKFNPFNYQKLHIIYIQNIPVLYWINIELFTTNYYHSYCGSFYIKNMLYKDVFKCYLSNSDFSKRKKIIYESFYFNLLKIIEKNDNKVLFDIKYFEHLLSFNKNQWLLNNVKCEIEKKKEVCCIDMEEYEEIVRTLCGHYISIDNLYKWVCENKRTNCPYCRTELLK